MTPLLVLDANVVVASATRADGFLAFGGHDLVAPAFMWAEARSSLHEAAWRGEIEADRSLAILERVAAGPVQPRDHPGLGHEAWRIADAMGWAKTYDAEYVALASLLRCRLVTLDRRLRRGADRLGFVVGPEEL